MESGSFMSVLEGITGEEIEQRITKIKEVRNRFVYDLNGTTSDAFSVMLRQLARKVITQQEPEEVAIKITQQELVQKEPEQVAVEMKMAQQEPLHQQPEEVAIEITQQELVHQQPEQVAIEITQ